MRFVRPRNIFIVIICAILTWIAVANVILPEGGRAVLPHNGIETPPTASDNLAINAGFEDGETSTTTSGWNKYWQGYDRDKSVRRSGDWSIRLTNVSFGTSAGARQRIDLQQTSQKPVFVGAYIRGDHVALLPEAFIGVSIYAEIVLADGSIVYWNSIRNSGTFDWRWVGFNTGTLPEVNQPIDHLFVIPAIVDATGTAWFDDITVREFEPEEAAVTLMFDDGFKSAYTIGRPTLAHYGFPGVIAAINDWVGRYGYMTTRQLSRLEKDGWEIVAHTLSHRELSTIPEEELDQELRESKKGFEEQGFTIHNVAFPYGDFNALAVAQAEDFYRSARLYIDGGNPAGTFPYGVHVRGITSVTTRDDVARWLIEAKAHGEWLILVFHNIETPAAEKFDTTPERFEQIVEEVAKSGLPVVTYNEGVDQFTIPEIMMYRSE
jgi:peptidoglycan/xylan/chitin deacetylase (PgdA/CDA1 family)